ncbi:hypothetical protein BD414DRAFT_533705 [Trametes punicea]|nr:hypothetical protein BD414DRAFT_533705 [Trametes punicea]
MSLRTSDCVRIRADATFSLLRLIFALPPRVAPKKDKKELDEDEVAFQQKKKQEEAALKAARDKAAKGGAPGGGIKKSGKK